MNIGYARASTQGQNLDRQIAALRKAGCGKVFREKATGRAVSGRPQLEKAGSPSAAMMCWWWPNGIMRPVP